MTRQDRANEIRDLITKVNGRIAELEEDDVEVTFIRNRVHITGQIQNIVIERTTKL